MLMLSFLSPRTQIQHPLACQGCHLPINAWSQCKAWVFNLSCLLWLVAFELTTCCVVINVIPQIAKFAITTIIMLWMAHVSFTAHLFLSIFKLRTMLTLRQTCVSYSVILCFSPGSLLRTAAISWMQQLSEIVRMNNAKPSSSVPNRSPVRFISTLCSVTLQSVVKHLYYLTLVTTMIDSNLQWKYEIRGLSAKAS